MRRGQLALGGYVALFVVFVFILVSAIFVFKPIADNVLSSEPTYHNSGLVWMWWLFPAVFVIGGLVMFFMPNTVVRQ